MYEVQIMTQEWRNSYTVLQLMYLLSQARVGATTVVEVLGMDNKWRYKALKLDDFIDFREVRVRSMDEVRKAVEEGKQTNKR